MKTKILYTFVAILFTTCGAWAYARFDFPGWPGLEEKSHDIIIVRCKQTPDPDAADKNGVQINLRGLIRSEMQIVSVLKGLTNSDNALVTSEYWPRQSEYYLVFADYHDGFYQAFERYRVVPLGIEFSTNLIANKTLDEQIHILLTKRLDDLNQEIQKEQQEKSLLEGELTK